MENVDDVLRDLGFEDREIRLYLVLMKNNNRTAMQLSKAAGIDRTTTYDLLERLMRKGIVSMGIINNTKHFSALTPKQLLSHFKEKYMSLESIIPQLNKSIAEKNASVKCELFYGKEGLKTVIKDLLSRGKDYKAIGIRKEYETLLGYFTDHAIITLNEFKAKETAIVEKDTSFRKLKNGNYKYLEKNKMPPVTTLLYDDISVFIIWTEPYFAIRIKNKLFAKAQEEYFSLMWGIAKK